MQIPFIAISSFLNFLENAGVIKQNALAFMGVDLEAFEKCEGGISVIQYSKLLSFAQEKLQDDFTGVRYGLYLNLQALGIIYQVSLTSESIHQALIYLKEYLASIFPIISLSVNVTERGVCIEFLPNETWKNIQGDSIHQSLIAISLLVYREISVMIRSKERAISIILPEEQTRFSEMLILRNIECEKGKVYGVCFSKKMLHKALPERLNYQLESLIVEYERILEKISAGRFTFKNQVKHQILHQMGMGYMPKVDDIAFQLNLSRRSFQRKLKDEGVSYREILEELLKTLSQKMLRHQKLSIQDISYVLGYSEPSAFNHAYQRWFGKTPNLSRKLGS